ncbi:PH domain-containing protein [Nocardioides zeae]|uniref:PH domain-containing protein n=1 Tax=Nocardioides imazamoxiresistens TaxID=3231893 RepID=A0ABU3PQJ2_9ACTN|nr:PH domain-containing protein [Nocardioides zeae]MDT9591484.1 PH domain-containing protein [Nocardioides zeae]
MSDGFPTQPPSGPPQGPPQGPPPGPPFAGPPPQAHPQQPFPQQPFPQQQPFPVPPPGSAPADDEGWRRQDARLLILGPVRALGQFAVPLLLSLIGVGTQVGPWTLLILPVALVGAFTLGALPWWTTTYRETRTHLELRSGIVNRNRQTASRDRVRSVDITTPLLHRILGVTKVEIGTGVDDSRIVLDVVTTAEAARLQAELLGPRRATSSAYPPAPGDPGAASGRAYPGGPGTPPPAPEPQPEPRLLASLSWSWLRFAPLNLAQLAIVAGALGAASQFLDDLPIWDLDQVSDAATWVAQQVLVVVLVVATVGLLLAWLVISLVGYVLTWFGFKLTREPGQHPGETSLKLTAGLLTTRSISVEERRVRGVEVVQPTLMRLAGGAQLSTLATGVEEGTTKVLPHCPVPVVLAVGNDVLGTPRDRGPLLVGLRGHGPRARRRAHVRWQWFTILAGLAATGATIGFSGPWWPPVFTVVLLAAWGVGGAELSYRNLGHALTRADDGEPWHLVAGSGGYSRVRTVLEVDGIIGWVLDQTWFQRRAGLVDLRATTAAGSEAVRVRDVPMVDAVAFAHAATPALVGTFAASA